MSLRHRYDRMQSINHKPQAARPATPDSKLHPRNRHRSRYDFVRLITLEPALRDFVETNAHGDRLVPLFTQE